MPKRRHPVYRIDVTRHVSQTLDPLRVELAKLGVSDHVIVVVTLSSPLAVDLFGPEHRGSLQASYVAPRSEVRQKLVTAAARTGMIEEFASIVARLESPPPEEGRGFFLLAFGEHVSLLGLTV